MKLDPFLLLAGLQLALLFALLLQTAAQSMLAKAERQQSERTIAQLELLVAQLRELQDSEPAPELRRAVEDLTKEMLHANYKNRNT